MISYRGGIYLIDWERSGIGDPAFELGLIPIFCHMGRECEDALYKSYIEDLEDSRSFLRRVEAYRAVHYFAWPIHMIGFLYKLKREGYKGTWNEDAFVRRYLSEAYDWLSFAFRKVGPLLGIEGEEQADSRSLKERGSLFLWKEELL
jgi:thiamine kinase-like enzyme